MAEKYCTPKKKKAKKKPQKLKLTNNKQTKTQQSNTAKVKEMLRLFPSQASTCNLIRCAGIYIVGHSRSIGKMFFFA